MDGAVGVRVGHDALDNCPVDIGEFVPLAGASLDP